MKTIWKFPLRLIDGPQSVNIPEVASIMLVAEQDGGPCIWAIVDPEAQLAVRIFRVYGTGHPLGDDVWVGSYPSAPFVWHVFEVMS